MWNSAAFSGMFAQKGFVMFLRYASESEFDKHKLPADG
jgi:hypothetical protein